MIEVTDADRAAWRGLPYRQSGVCSKCGESTFVAGLKRSKLVCLPDFAATRHRRLGQLRRLNAQ